MKIEIWSDVACPFCYIGKAHLEKALASFAESKDVEVVYKSYQLDPDYHYQEGDTSYSHLTEKKGIPMEQVKQMTTRIEQMAGDAGLKMDIQSVIPANTFDAHRLIQLAARHNKEEQVVTALFKAHFADAKNIEEQTVLRKIGLQAGLSKDEVDSVFNSDELAYDVSQDIMESRNLGITGVPFFLFNRKYAVSGAQPVEVFEGALAKSFSEWRKEHPVLVSLNTRDDAACTDEGCGI